MVQRIALILAGITVIEVGMHMFHDLPNSPVLIAPMFIILSGLVCLYQGVRPQ